MNNLFELDKQLIQLQYEASSREEVTASLAKRLEAGGYIKSSFLPAVLEREKTYPTGLPLATFGVAIPHTDPEHVNHPAISVATLKESVIFHKMGNPDETVEAKIVFVLAITEPSKQLVMLEKLMTFFRKEEIMTKLSHLTSYEEAVELLQQELNQ
ncbi:PTS sugar transporter subunit IIA [Bacillus sp. FJAT-53060]|uniref:PTS sugar transporter subunit IIA n=1 Tax=Bacillus TaxID=1386 RepID=UPI001CFB18BA|nr:PTS sugar transporter subunit IIA [Bacillus stratosphericus]